MKRFVVIGLGNFGATAALSLQAMGHQVSVVDSDRERVQRMAERIATAVVGDGTVAEVLEQAGARDADAAIVSTGGDVTASVLSALALRDSGIREIYVKVVSDLHARILAQVGIADAIFPEREAAQLLARRASSQAILNYVTLGTDFSAQEMAVPAEWVGRTLRELELRRRFNVSVLAIHDFLADEIRPVPDPDAPLKDSDSLLVAGWDENLARLTR